MRWWWWWAIGGAAVIGIVLVSRDALARRLSQSPTADRLGLDNTPTGAVRTRLLYIARAEAAILAALRPRWPGAHVSSGYRAPAVNEAVGGAVGSRHTYGLALDFGGVGDLSQSIDAVRALRSAIDSILPRPRTVIAEDDHPHLDWHDPLGEIDGPAPWGPPRYLVEQPGQTPRFVSLT